MPVHKCDILVYRLYQGDATSQHTFELARILADLGIQPAIFSNYPLDDLPADIRSLAQQSSYAAYPSGADLTILQYPLWFPLAERVAQVLARSDLWQDLVDRGRQQAHEFTTQAFRVRAALAISEALNMEAAGFAAPEASMPRSELYRLADTLPRAHAVTSPIPLLGEYIAQARAVAAYHLKEAYFDRVMERLVSFNRLLAESISTLDREIPSADPRPAGATDDS